LSRRNFQTQALARISSHFMLVKSVRWILCLLESNICRLGKQPHRLPNIGLKAITHVGLDETSPTYRNNTLGTK
jgi:hypothetical protein